MVQINNIFSRSFETPLPIIFIPFILYFRRDVASFGGEKGEEEEKKLHDYIFTQKPNNASKEEISILSLFDRVYIRDSIKLVGTVIRLTILYRPHRIGARCYIGE